MLTLPGVSLISRQYLCLRTCAAALGCLCLRCALLETGDVDIARCFIDKSPVSLSHDMCCCLGLPLSEVCLARDRGC